MNKDENEKLERFLDKCKEKNISIKQDGVIKNGYEIMKMKYHIKYDILNIKDESTENYIEINLNQIYQIESDENQIEIYLDSDINIKLSIKNR